MAIIFIDRISRLLNLLGFPQKSDWRSSKEKD